MILATDGAGNIVQTISTPLSVNLKINISNIKQRIFEWSSLQIVDLFCFSIRSAISHFVDIYWNQFNQWEPSVETVNQSEGEYKAEQTFNYQKTQQTIEYQAKH